MTTYVTYVGASPIAELSITGKPGTWQPGQRMARSDADAALLLASGNFQADEQTVKARSTPGQGIGGYAGGQRIGLSKCSPKMLAAIAGGSPFSVMASGAPTITASVTGSGTPSIAGAVKYKYNSGVFEYYGGFEPNGWDEFGGWYHVSRGASYGYGGPTGFAFISDAPVFELYFYGNGYATGFSVLIDGKLASATETGILATGTQYMFKVDLGAVAQYPRLIEIIYSRQPFGGVFQHPRYTIAKPTAPVRGIVLGDSYTEHFNGTQQYKGFAPQLGRRLGVRNIWASGIGGTGYVNANSLKNLPDRLSHDLIGYGMFDFILVAMGINDAFYTTAQATQDAAKSTLKTIRDNYPGSLVVAASGWRPRNATGGSNATQQGYVDAIANAAAYADVEFVDTTNWLLGTGKVGSLANDGNSDVYVGTDGTHPPDAGYEYLAFRMAEEIKRLIGL